ncbi:MAG: AMP-binding protein [Myxococcota bacterium]
MPLVSYGRALSLHAERQPDAIALVHEGRTTRYGELDRAANRLARLFARCGVGEGDFVTLALPNGREFVEALFACWKLGATPQPVSPRLPRAERDAILALVAPKLVVGPPVGEVPGGRALSARGDAGAHAAHVVGSGAGAGESAGPAVLEAGFDASGESDAPLPDRVSRYRMAICSGGSTGRPKVVVDHIPAQCDPEATYHGQPPGTSILVPGPLYHSAPLINCLSVLLGGGKVVAMTRFDPAESLRLIEEHRLALAIFVPTMMVRIWKLPREERERFDLSSLARVVSSSAFLPEWLRREWIEWIGPDRVWEAYGGSERIVGTLISGREWLARPGSVGRVSEGRKIKIVGPDGETLPPGEIGDVYGMPPGGPGSTYHYLGAEPRRLADGWETLGDMGYLDEDGFLYLVDRRTDLVITGGANVYPAEVEGAIESHPAVLACAVIGLPDDDLGAVVHAIVQLAKPIAEDELRRHVEERLVRYKVPRSFELVSEQLKDDAGKVRRAALRAERIAARERAKGS